MKKNFRFYIALWISKAAMLLQKLLGMNASYFPGKIAIKLCPDFLGRIDKPKTIITRTDFIGNIMTLCLGKRGELVKQEYVSGNRVELHYDMPLAEIVIDFYDKLKSISKGYASFDYHPIGFRTSKLVKLDILLNGEPVDALSTLFKFPAS